MHTKRQAVTIYQPVRTLAESDAVRFHGQSAAARAEIVEMTRLLAHADRDEWVDWMAPLQEPLPTGVLMVCGKSWVLS